MADQSRGELMIRALHPLLKQRGFTRKGTHWYAYGNQVIHVVNVQGSRWSKDDCHINVAIGLLPLLDTDTPKESQCPIRNRISADNTIDAIMSDIVAWFEQYGTLEKLVNHMDNGTLPPATYVQAKEYLRKK